MRKEINLFLHACASSLFSNKKTIFSSIINENDINYSGMFKLIRLNRVFHLLFFRRNAFLENIK